MSLDKRRVSLAGAIYHGGGKFHALVHAPAAENRETILAYGSRSGDVINLIPVSGENGEEEIVSLIKTFRADAKDEPPHAVALTNEGDVLFISGPDLWRETIPFAGYHNDRSRRLGYMTNIAQVGSGFVATGHGGQVYLRDSDSWQTVDDHQPGQGRAKSLYSAVELEPGRIALAGVEISDLDGNEDIERANAESDAALLADLILSSLEPDEAIVRIYDGSWQTRSLPESAALSPILKWREGWIVASSQGNIWQTDEFEAFQALWSPREPGPHQDLEPFGVDILVLRQHVLYRLADGDLEEFDPAPPAADRTFLSVSSHGPELALVENLRIAFFNGTGWTTLTPVM